VDAGPVDVPQVPPAADAQTPGPMICTPAQKRCMGATTLETCTGDGTAWTTAACTGATPHCVGNACVACFMDSHCPASTCRQAVCDLATHTCTTRVDAGAGCPGKGTCSPMGQCLTPVSVGAFSIDATEVTRSQYAAFLAAKGNDTAGQPSFCSWNTSYVPTQDWPAQPGTLARPVAYVDWCDARAYCTWMGKRLCGRIGGGSATAPDEYDRYNSYTASEWHAACTADGERIFPYSYAFIAGRCRFAADSTVDVASLTTCEGGYPGIFDLTGNLSEWEDRCMAATGPTDFCRLRGGSYRTDVYRDGVEPGTFTRCDYNLGNPRNLTSDIFGIRCCQDN
jgi:hypothetical protein